MDDSLWDKVLPAAAALAGVTFASLIEWRRTNATRKHERRTLLLAKLEQLNEAVSETLAWTDHVMRATQFEQLRALNVPIPPRRAFALTMVYFPTLQPAALKFLTESLAFSSYLVELPRFDEDVTVAAYAQRFHRSEFAEVTSRFTAARQALDEAILAFAAANIGT